MSLERTVLDDDGLQKFPLIASRIKVATSLSHGNNAPGNGFSINKYMLQLRRNFSSADDIEALLFVKDTILSFGGILVIPITKALLESSKLENKQNVISRKRKKKQRKEERLNSRKRRMTKMKETPSSHESSK